jgi:glycosyltransferase involved in cell wall biosynthesis
LSGLKDGTTPRDFFYGFTSLKDSGYPAEIIDSRFDPNDWCSRVMLKTEYLMARLTGVGINTQRVKTVAVDLASRDIAVSFTDSFSLSLGLYRARIPQCPVLAGGFHGLADIAAFARPGFRSLAQRVVRRALEGLDHLFFFGPGDRERAIEMYSLDPSKTSLFPFGVDLEFWRPAEGDVTTEGVFSVGSDPKRDYPTLLAAPIDGKIRILTSLNVRQSATRSGVEILRGNLYGSSITDDILRSLYQQAQIVVVPLLDVWQPTGYSVTLQAMACGKPVILSNIRGLWDREVFESGANCILVPPGDAEALGSAVHTLQTNVALRERIGKAARQLAVHHFGLSRMENALEAMVNSLAPAKSV